MSIANVARLKSPAPLVVLAAALTPIWATGCFHSWINDWLDPSEMGAFDTVHTSEIRRSISVLEEPGGLAAADEPVPDDLVIQRNEYRISEGDLVSVRIYELLGGGTETIVTPIVGESGSIYIPELEWLQVVGLTARELQKLIKEELETRNILFDANVDVNIPARRQRVFHVFGFINRAGTYPIPEPDFRLLEALLAAGGLTDLADQVYVFRTQEVAESGPSGGEPTTTEPTATGSMPDSKEGRETTGGIDGDPVQSRDLKYEFVNYFMTSFDRDGFGIEQREGAVEAPTADAEPDIEAPPETQASQPLPETLDQDLLEALRPPGEPPAVPATMPEPPVSPESDVGPEDTAVGMRTEAEPITTQEQPPLSQWIWRNGEWVEVTTKPAEEGQVRVPIPTGPATIPTRRVVDWQDLEVPPTNRVISIPADPLRNGDPRYNIVIRDNDSIRIAAGQTGNYYMMGNVLRPGVYSLAGFNLTIKQAIASAGGLGPLAWPDRCDVIRRIGPDRETVIPVNLDRIFAGQDPDFFLKPNDIVNVGTHAVAPFLATIRSAFRVTYGFGFVWDRNFGDIESQGGSPNPRIVREAARAAQLPGLFP